MRCLRQPLVKAAAFLLCFLISTSCATIKIHEKKWLKCIIWYIKDAKTKKVQLIVDTVTRSVFGAKLFNDFDEAFTYLKEHYDEVLDYYNLKKEDVWKYITFVDFYGRSTVVALDEKCKISSLSERFSYN